MLGAATHRTKKIKSAIHAWNTETNFRFAGSERATFLKRPAVRGLVWPLDDRPPSLHLRFGNRRRRCHPDLPAEKWT